MKRFKMLITLIVNYSLCFSQITTIYYQYDSVGQLKKVSSFGMQEISYYYDEVGNRISQVVTFTGTRTLDLKVLIEGPFNSTSMNPTLNTLGVIPLIQPFNTSPWNYSGTEAVGSIPNSNVIDWLLIELRDAPDAVSATEATRVSRRAAFLLSDGSVVGMDGFSNLEFTNPINHQLFVVIRHRNHLPILSANPLILTDGVYSCNFTTSAEMAYGGLLAQKQLATGVWGMIAGDCDANGEINMTDEDLYWESNAGNVGYIKTDLNLDGQVDNRDKDNVWLPNEGQGSEVPE
jgi:hypothetical protein